jgi:lipid-A-disaccharide synthase
MSAGPAQAARLRVAIVAGESSGDTLGAALIEALRQRCATLEVFGVAGPKMRAAGCEVLADAHALSVMGLFEVLPHLPRLLALRARLARQIAARRPDVFIGVDYQQFNLGLALRLKRRGFATVQYVSPQVWAWREARVRTIGQAFDLVLCLLPFEPDFYR